MVDSLEDSPTVDAKDLNQKAKQDPKSKKWNNPNSRRNLTQYQDKNPALNPEVVGESQEDGEVDVTAIVVGRKLSPEIVRKLMPQRGVLTAAERKRYVGIVQQYLGDFRSEEPTAVDVDDIFEIAESDIMKTRLLQAAKGSPDAIVNINQALERIYKRKQSAKENLSARRSDRKDARDSQDISIIDLITRYDLERRKLDEERVTALLAEEEVADGELKDVLEKDGY